MDAVDPRDGYVLLRVRVQPRASRNAIVCEPDGRVRVALTAPPLEGRANQALRAFVAKAFGIPKSAVELAAGQRGRHKTLRLDGVTGDEVVCMLSGTQSSG
ncbi:MAG: YggU family protein [Candidatus Hydrogenedentes bacterium]|nr:YggU family protein [Candidatus Hydrogenedentota bacterium]